MQRCPNCHEKAISNISKVSLGPASEVKCTQCQTELTVPWYSLISIFLFLIGGIILFIFVERKMFYIVFTIGALILSYIHLRYVPLIKK